MSKIKMRTDSFPDESPLPALQMNAFLLYPHRVEKERSVSSSFIRTLIPSLGPHDLI